MSHGGKRPGSGRKPGTSTKLNQKAREQAAEGGLMPLDYMLSILRSEDRSPADRFEAAKAAAPYVHAKLAAVELSGGLSFSHEDALAELDEPEGEGDTSASES
jgi:hypothetical protein